MKIDKSLINSVIKLMCLNVATLTLIVAAVIKTEFSKRAETEIFGITSAYAEVIESFISQKLINLETVSNLRSVVAFTANGNADADYIDYADIQEIDDIKQTLRSFTESENYIMSIDIINKDGMIIISSEEKNQKRLSDFPETVKNAESLQKYKNAVVTAGGNLQKSYGNAPYFYIAKGIRKNNELIGYAAMKISLDYFLQLARTSEKYNMGYIAIIDSNGNFTACESEYLYKNIGDMVTESGETLKEILDNAVEKYGENGFFKFKFDGLAKTVYFSYIGESGWAIMTSADKNAIKLSPRASAALMLAFAVAAALNVIIMAFILKKYLKAPVRSFIKSFKKLSDNETEETFDEKLPYEFGEIAGEINGLIRKISVLDKAYESLAENSLLCMTNFPGGLIKCAANDGCDIDFVSASFLELTECSESDIDSVYSAGFFDAVHPDDVEKVRKKMRLMQEGQGPTELEFRLRKKNGDYIWVRQISHALLDENNRLSYYGIIVDISGNMAMTKAYKKVEERYNKIVDWTEDIVFEWDKAEETISFSPGAEQKLGYLPIKLTKDGGFLAPQNINPEDLDKFSDTLERVFFAVTGCETELRFKRLDDNAYVWYKMKVDAILNENGAINKVMGILLNIDYKKQEEAQKKCVKDNFSGFYTVESFETIVNDIIRSKKDSSKCALLVFKIDDYKNLRAKTGLRFTETILSDISIKLSYIAKDDIIARTEESKFAIFMTGVRNRQALANKINELTNTLEGSYTHSNGKSNVTGCIGATLIKNGDEFVEIMDNANKALADAQAKGCGKYCIYNAETE